MKMPAHLYEAIVEAFTPNAEKIQQHRQHLQESGKFQDLDTRLGWDCYRAFVPAETRRAALYEGLKDAHITTALKKALREVLA